MACGYRYLGALCVAWTTACSGDNPLFHLGTISGGTTEIGETTNGTTPTSGDATTDLSPTDASLSVAAATTDDASATDTTDGATHGPATTTTTDANTTIDPVDSSGGSSGVVDGCGDGDLQGEEECDHGADNGMGGECTSDCKLDACGNAYVGPGEECDDGDQNSETAACTPVCLKNVCGDGYPHAGVEMCDEAGNNGKQAPGCSDDCLSPIPAKTLRIAVTPPYPGKLYDGDTPGVKGADGLCNMHFPGFKAMIGGNGRVASEGDYDGSNQSPDWPVQKYRAYTRKDNVTIVFVTGSEGLPGVANNKPIPLVNPIAAGHVWTGFTPTWTNATDNCNSWAKSEDAVKGQFGDAAATSSEFISAEKKACNSPAGIYCVEVPG